ncbi:MAG: adenosylhomocysteinase, partial [Acidobacteriota bacterium]
TQDDVAAALVGEYGGNVFAIRAEDTDTYYDHIKSVAASEPNVTMDDGCDLVSTLHSDRRDLLEPVVGGTEETTTGVIRLRAMTADGSLRYPVIAVNDALTKHLFDNRYGTGQSTIDGVLRATNLLLSGMTVVVAGYGWCGRGIATRAMGMGAQVIVCEIDPVRALEASMDGFRVMPMSRAAREGDLFVTATGNKHVLRREHFEKMKSGAIVANSGHFNVEIDIPALDKLSKSRRRIRDVVDVYTLKNGREISLLAEGRLVNLSAAEGHPASVMDMSFANQALCAEHLVRTKGRLEPGVYTVPEPLDRKVAALKLSSMGIRIDKLTAEQKSYQASWQEGT